MNRILVRLVLLAVVGWVWLPFVPFSVLGDANTALVYAIPAISLVLLTGWVGQISLAQAAFVGIGAFGTAFLARRGLTVPFPFSIPVMGMLSAVVAMLLGVVALRVRGLYLAVGTLIFGWMADSYLFGSPWFAGAGGSATVKVTPIGRKGAFPYFDFSDRRTFYYAALAGVGLAIVGLINLRQSRTGRAFFAIRGSEMAAASLGIDVTRYKLLAFAISGFIAGMAGNIIITGQGTIVPAQFNFTISLFYLAVAVVGGLQSLPGAVASGVLFALLNELFFRVQALHGWLEVVSAGLLAGVLLFYPGGLAAMPAALRIFTAKAGLKRPGAWIARRADRIAGALGKATGFLTVPAKRVLEGVRAATSVTTKLKLPSRSRPAAAPIAGPVSQASIKSLDVPDLLQNLSLASTGNGSAAIDPHDLAASQALSEKDPEVGGGGLSAISLFTIPEYRLPPRRQDRLLMLEASGVTVRFGGLVAVDDASLQVRQGEIVGLIGPNGAGKTTLFNAVAGFNSPQAGKVRVKDREITNLPVHQRAALGIGRTFQVIQLFPQLTVFENLLVATHIRNPTGFLSHLAVTMKAGAMEAESGARVKKVISFLGLEEVADRRVAGLPFGTLRMVEVARALVTGSPLVMLDEPASGLDSKETEGFANLLKYLRAKLGLSILLIEHDVALVMKVCDYVYVIDRGKLIAEGTPDEVQADTAVITAYLGSPAGKGEQEEQKDVAVNGRAKNKPAARAKAKASQKKVKA